MGFQKTDTKWIAFIVGVFSTGSLSDHEHGGNENFKNSKRTPLLEEHNFCYAVSLTSPVIPFFCSRLNFPDELAPKRLLRRLLMTHEADTSHVMHQEHCG